MRVKYKRKAAFITYWMGQSTIKRTGSNSNAKFEDIRSQLLSSTDNYEIVTVVEAGSKSEEDITSQLLGCINEYKIDPVVDKENGDQADDIVTKKEKMLYEQLKKIDEVFLVVSEIYRNGMVPPEVSPKSLRGNKPSPLKRRSESIIPLKKKINSRCPSTPPFRIHRSNNNRNNNWREKMWWRDTTLFKNNIVDICYLESIHILNKLKYRYLFINLWVGVRTCNII